MSNRDDERDYGYLASLLPPEGQAIYEANRIPAWEAYQAAIKLYANLSWQEAEPYTKAYWRTYRTAVADAYAKAIGSERLKAEVEALEGSEARRRALRNAA